ncbi:MAG TPA: sugar phosphate isomerase/epimerase family protein [Bryobacteraceae bacterium]|nr:sugar phosphate isomerase/epimerase family protein [Bryobacteraceae bacterium]HPT28112.1 sugar phosphate isomerase/epimerase family protein [Bryobacteraceae bacterium]
MNRRSFLAASAAAMAPLQAANKINWSRISVLTDEVAKTPEEALAFCRQYDLKWVELRGVPGQRKSYFTLEGEDLKAAAKQFKDARLGISFLNTGMLKFDLPGTVPARKRNESDEQKAARAASMKAQFDRRLETLRQAITAAHAFDVDIVRIFTFSRVEDPDALLPRIAEILGEMVAIAEKEGVRLLVENEGSCNVATSAELAKICSLISSKSFGINWDPVNELPHKAVPFPDGYKLLPKRRIINVQMKARALVVGPDFLDWKGILGALEADGYRGKVGLETHVFDGTLIEKAHLCMAKIKELVR